MADFQKLEKDVGGEKTSKPTVGRMAVPLVSLGVGLIAFGIYLSTTGTTITADTAGTEPPSPNIPQRDSTEITPPTPNIPVQDVEYPPVPAVPNEFTFGAGWSIVSGESLYGYDLTNFRDAGLSLYSFNDPKYANRDWAIVSGSSTECAKEKIGCDVIVPQPPLGYYVYNPKSTQSRVTLKPSTAPDLSTNIYGRGWHLMYWGGDAIAQDDLLDKISIKYSDGKKLTAKQAVLSTEHRVSLKLYGIFDETTIDPTKAIKDLKEQNVTELTTLPKGSYFWLYLRRTAKRVTGITINDAVAPVSENILIDGWITTNNLTECGDPAGTIYTGGSCLFDESTGTYRDKYELIKAKFPDKPWQQ